MIRAYQKIYLNKAQSVLADALDYAVNQCGIAGSDFLKLYSVSSFSRRMENGEAALLMGKSGIEIAVDILYETTGRSYDLQPEDRMTRSVEYRIGWAVAYYQWHSSKSYSDIFRVLSYEELIHMYSVLHEADISKFADIAEERMQEYFRETNLKRIRTAYGCSQSGLAALSGVTLRSIQMYEQRSKDINKASAETLYRLSEALGCTMEDLLEHPI